MYTAKVGEICHHKTNLKDTVSNFILICFCFRMINQGVNFRLGKPVYLSQFTNDRLSLECGGRTQESCMLMSVAFKYVVKHIIPLFPGIINVKIRWTGTVWINESLKIQNQFNRVNIGYSQAIGYN